MAKHHKKPRRGRRRRIDWGGCPKLRPTSRSQRRLRYIAELIEQSTRCYITATTNGTHTSTSYHYQRRAIDFGGPSTAEKTKAQMLVFHHVPHSWLAEFFGPRNYPWVKNGVAFTEPEGVALEDQHDTHLHVAC